jgi:hypothetical protein
MSALLGGFFLTGAIEKRMKAKNRNAAGDVVDHWNHVSIRPTQHYQTIYHRFSVLFRTSQNGSHSLPRIRALERP